MNLICKLVLASTLTTFAFVAFHYYKLSLGIPAPKLDPQQYWGPDSSSNYKENTDIKPFDITTKPEIIEDLKAQLARPLKLTDPLEHTSFEYGFNSKYLKDVVKYWRDSYLTKWNEREAYLQKFPHFETQIQGLRIHFMHIKPKKTDGKQVIPLILLHGWPGSIREFYEFIPLLTTPNVQSEYVFEVIAPSLPGYGWSQGSSKMDFGPLQISVVMRNLMLRLGHNKFLIHGGDWGSVIGSHLAALFPQNVLGYYSNMCGSNSVLTQVKLMLINVAPSLFVDEQYKHFHKPFLSWFAYIMEESGYAHIQATKPDTIGAALSHNPIGLAAYILEKFSTWTNVDYKKLQDGGLTQRFSLDALLDNVMIYYLTNSITTSMRIYAEEMCKKQMEYKMGLVKVEAPTGCARFKHELAHATDFELKDKFRHLVHSSYFSDGGHFPALELPNVLYEDFLKYVRKALKIKVKEPDQNIEF